MEQSINSLVRKYYKNRIVGHICRDSTATAAREKPVNKKKPNKDNKSKRKRGRPKKGKVVSLTKQLHQKPGKSLK